MVAKACCLSTDAASTGTRLGSFGGFTAQRLPLSSVWCRSRETSPMSERPPFPSTAAEFYRLRDHRTDLYDGVVPAYTERAVRVTIDRDTVQTYLGQMMLIITANLLSRWCRRVDLQVPDVVLHARFRLSGSVSELVL